MMQEETYRAYLVEMAARGNDSIVKDRFTGNRSVIGWIITVDRSMYTKEEQDT